MRWLMIVGFLVNWALAVSLDEKIGQMLMLGFPDQQVSANTAFVQDLQRYHIGGVILGIQHREGELGNIHDPRQLKRLVKQLQHYSQIPLLVAIDQEGGRVERLRVSNGFSHTLSAQQLGRLDNIAITRANTQVIVKELHEVGINVNFAPVLDLNINPDNPIIGKRERSFSANVAVVTHQAKIIAATLAEQQIACAFKHFPGHGSSTQDSHNGFTDVSETWSPLELEPYQQLGDTACDMIMVGHVFNHYLDAKYPASLSHDTIENLLRKQIHFNGVVITDGLGMGAIAKEYSLRDTIKLAVNAGNDILLFADNLHGYNENLAKKVFITFKDLLQKGEISQQRIDESYARIMCLKEKLFVLEHA